MRVIVKLQCYNAHNVTANISSFVQGDQSTFCVISEITKEVGR